MIQENAFIPIILSLFAGASTALGAILVLKIKRFNPIYLSFSLGLSAGAMIYVSFVELLSSAETKLGFLSANAAFFLGIIAIMLVDFIMPHNYIAEHVCPNKERQCGQGFGNKFSEQKCERNYGNKKRLATAGVFTAIGIAIHNFPEGASVLLGGINDYSLGLSLALAIAVHNIPEGISVATPIYYATKSRWKAFYYALVAGLAEPIGAILTALFLLPFLNQNLFYLSLSFVAGIMVFISFDELLPLCFKNCRKGHSAIIGVTTGMILMATSLYFI